MESKKKPMSAAENGEFILATLDSIYAKAVDKQHLLYFLSAIVAQGCFEQKLGVATVLEAIEKLDAVLTKGFAAPKKVDEEAIPATNGPKPTGSN